MDFDIRNSCWVCSRNYWYAGKRLSELYKSRYSRDSVLVDCDMGIWTYLDETNQPDNRKRIPLVEAINYSAFNISNKMGGPKYKVLLFDFDGVIVDSFDLSYQSMRSVNPNPPDKDEYRNWFDGNIYDRENSDEENHRDWAEQDNPYFQTHVPLLMKTEPVNGMVEAVKELHKKYRMVVVSSTINSPIKSYLDKHDLSKHFDKIYGGGVHKRKLRKIHMVFKEFNVRAEDCLFITDTLGDMREAAEAGVKSVGVTWGFQKKENLEKGDPAAIVRTPSDLISLLA